MNLENAKSVVYDGGRVIGLKNDDMVKLSNQYENSRESSFTAVDDIINPVIESVGSGQPEIVASEVIPEQPTHDQSLVEPTVLDNPVSGFVQQTPVVEAPTIQAVEQPSIYPDAPQSVETTPDVPVMPSVEPAMPASNEQPYVSVPPVSFVDEVQGGQTMYDNSNLDTPQTFFDRVEQGVSNGTGVQEELNNNSYVNQDPAILLIDNVKKVVEDKNSMIQALSDKVTVLENQLKVSEEARRVAEAQRDAAHATLSQARQAETLQSQPQMQTQPQVQPQVQQGPTLTYQQQMYQ